MDCLALKLIFLPHTPSSRPDEEEEQLARKREERRLQSLQR